MPYIAPDQRPELDQGIKLLHKDLVASGHSAAKLNYVISSLVNKYVEYFGLRYQAICEVQGVLEGAAGEFKRVVSDVYEARKEQENGTVWSCMETEPPGLTNEQVEALMIYDEHGWSWMRCEEGDCDLHVVGPGKVSCDNCDQKIDPDFQQGEV
jgi:hypothetical protein